MDSQKSKLPTSSQTEFVPLLTTELLDLRIGKTSLKGFKGSKSSSVLVTGAGSPGFIPIVEALRDYRVIGVDMDKNAIGKGFVDRFYAVPPAKDDSFIPKMAQICEKEKVDVVLPKITVELEKLAGEKLGKTKVLISDLNTIKRTNNKLVFLQTCFLNKIPTPKHFATNKFCLKPIFGSGSDGFKIIGLSAPMLVMDYVSGKEYSVDILAQNGRPLITVPRLRKKIKAGISVEGEVVKEDSVIFWAEEIVKLFNLNGIVGLQFKMDKNNIPIILECNPRMHGTLALTIRAGANLPDLAVKMALGESFNKPDIRWGTKMKRYLKEIYE